MFIIIKNWNYNAGIYTERKTKFSMIAKDWGRTHALEAEIMLLKTAWERDKK